MLVTALTNREAQINRLTLARRNAHRELDISLSVFPTDLAGGTYVISNFKTGDGNRPRGLGHMCGDQL